LGDFLSFDGIAPFLTLQLGIIQAYGGVMRRAFAIAWKVAIVGTVWSAVGWLTGYLRPLDASLGIELPAWVQIPGIVAVVAGAVEVLACGAILSTRGIGTLRGEEWFMPRDFLATGPFRCVRNPMSLGAVVLMVGIALLHRSMLALGLAATLFMVFHLVVVFLEEPGLEKRFGERYQEYRRNVPRWLPRLRPWRGFLGP
jgi:protein-S-isoprenylcysteine O-methyltransferase Ste14